MEGDFNKWNNLVKLEMIHLRTTIVISENSNCTQNECEKLSSSSSSSPFLDVSAC